MRQGGGRKHAISGAEGEEDKADDDDDDEMMRLMIMMEAHWFKLLKLLRRGLRMNI